MHKLILALLILFGFLPSPSAASVDAINSDIVISNVQRAIDLTTHLPKIITAFSVENSGKTAVTSFLHAAEPGHGDQLAFIGAVVKSGDHNTPLKVAPTTVAGHEAAHFHRVTLANPLAAGKKANVEVEAAYSHSLRAYPSQIAQAEKQLMEWDGALYYFTPYKVNAQTTTVTTATANIESYTKPAKVSDAVITYGPHADVAPLSAGALSVHFEHNAPFLAVTQLTRLIEVSHWGNLAVEETLDVRHAGAALRGAFSRYDFQRQQEPGSAVKDFKTLLPAAARDVYYRDEIGNISTSHLREQDDAVEVELRPRFPLFGGWKTHYMIGYNLPSYQYLYTKGDEYLLKMRFVDHVIDDQVIDAMALRIVLPEGAQNIRFTAPYAVEREDAGREYTYLDTVGRPVVVARKTMLTEHHIQDFELRYSFQRALMLQEPLLLVSAFFLLFLTIIIYVRLDFTITKDAASESRQRVAALLEQTGATQDRRSALYQAYDDTVEKFKQTKDMATFVANRKKIDTDYKTLCGQLAGLLAKLRAEGSEAADKVSELQKLDGLMRDQITLNITHAEKLIANKMQKQQYVDGEKVVSEKRAELYQKMEALLTAL